MMVSKLSEVVSKSYDMGILGWLIGINVLN